MTFSEWLDLVKVHIAFARDNWKREDGQTMAEYGVVLAVITLGVVVALGLLSGGIGRAIDSVTSKLPAP
jgi:Flp pilus assembly pilin Flp